GTITLLEMARVIGLQSKTGWRPRRTLLLGSWDGEEYGLLGSTEWAEGNDAMLAHDAVAYLNVDAAVSGDSLRVNGSQALEAMIGEVLRDVRDPLQNRSLWNVVMDRTWARSRASWSAANRLRRLRGEPARPFEFDMPALGSGSDYTAFLD